MRTLVTRVLWLAGIGAILYGGFVAYERWWDGDWGALKDRAFSLVRETTQTIKERAEEKGGEVLESAKEEATETAKGAIASAVGGVIESVGETIARFGESIAGMPARAPAPAASDSIFSVPPPPVALSAKAGASLTFAVNEGTAYAAEWGDSVKDEGEKDKNETVLLRHAWTVPGDYTITLTTRDNGVTHREVFPVRIYESR